MASDRLVPTPAPADLPTYKISVGGGPIDDSYQVLAITVTKEVNRITEAEIIIMDDDVPNETFPTSDKADFLPGQTIEIQAGYHQTNETIFKGTIIKHKVKALQNDSSVLIITAKHDAYKMTLSRKNRIFFKDKKDSDAMNTILGDYGLAGTVGSTSVTHESLLQFNATDWDFVVMRAEMNKMIAICENDKVSVKEIKVEGPKLKLYFGSSIIEFEAEIDPRSTFKSYKIESWDYSFQKMNKADGSGSVKEQGDKSADDLGGAIHYKDMQVNMSNHLADSEGSKIMDSRSVRSKVAKTRGRVKCIGFSGLQPGDTIELNGVGKHFNGSAFVSGVRHYITHGKWESDIQFGLDYRTHAENFNDIAEKPASGMLPPVNGLHLAVVTKLQDDPKGEDRIQIKIPLLSESDEAMWVRISTLDAGHERGSFFRPEIGDEILLGFLNDDPRNAIMLGMLNSSAKPAPLKAEDKNDFKGFFTRSKMKIEFDDGKKIMTLWTPADNMIELNEDKKSITIKDQNNNKIILNEDGIEITSIKDIKMTAQNKITIEAQQEDINITADTGSLTASGTGGATITTPQTLTLSGSSIIIG
jgi:Rhs element Vgr protein